MESNKIKVLDAKEIARITKTAKYFALRNFGYHQGLMDDFVSYVLETEAKTKHFTKMRFHVANFHSLYFKRSEVETPLLKAEYLGDTIYGDSGEEKHQASINMEDSIMLKRVIDYVNSQDDQKFDFFKRFYIDGHSFQDIGREFGTHGSSIGKKVEEAMEQIREHFDIHAKTPSLKPEMHDTKEQLIATAKMYKNATKWKRAHRSQYEKAYMNEWIPEIAEICGWRYRKDGEFQNKKEAVTRNGKKKTDIQMCATIEELTRLVDNKALSLSLDPKDDWKHLSEIFAGVCPEISVWFSKAASKRDWLAQRSGKTKMLIEQRRRARERARR